MSDDLALRAWNGIELCAGAGALGLGIKLAVPFARGVAYVEREAAAAALLVTRMEAGDLAPAPVWSDLGSFDARAWRGRVHFVASGDPCQPNSVAGKRGGVDDERFLADQVVRIVAECRPHRLFRENVPGNADGQLGVLVPALEGLGYRVAAGIFSSKATANSHGRERLVLMADDTRCPGWVYPRPWRPDEGPADSGGVGGTLGDASGARRCPGKPGEGGALRDQSVRAQSDRRGGDVGNAFGDAHGRTNVTGSVRGAPSAPEEEARRADGQRLRGRSGNDGEDLADADVARSSLRLGNQERRGALGHERASTGASGVLRLPIVAPGPADARWSEFLDADPLRAPALGQVDLWAVARRRLGLPPMVDAVGRRGGMARDLDAATTAAIKFEVRRMADAMAGRVERLRALGNGVDPVVGWDAWVHLDALQREARERERAGAAAVMAIEA